MAITTRDGALAGMQWPRFYGKTVTPTLVAGKPQSLWGLAGMPGAGAFDTTLNGVVLSQTSAQVSGALNFVNPGSGNSYLARFSGQSTQAGVLILADRIWHNGGYTVTSTSAQSITSPTWPARDSAGSTNGDGVILGVECSATMGASAPTSITIAYTNSAGTAGRSAVNYFPTATSASAGSFFPIGLQSGDFGVRSVQSLTLATTWTSGTIALVAYRPLAYLELTGSNIPNAVDFLSGGFPRMYDGNVPFFIFIPNTTTASNISGSVVWSQG